MSLLHAGDTFPDLRIAVAGGAEISVPAATAGKWGVVLFSRGASCRSCVEQLRAFQRSATRFDRAGVQTVALSADDEATTAELVSHYDLTYPVGHSADPGAVAELTGAFVSFDPPQLQTTGFIVDPTGTVAVSVYSCGAVGRLLPDDVLEVVREGAVTS